MNLENIGKIIKERREDLGLSQYAVAKAINISPNTINNIESGKNGNLKNVLDIIHHLRMNIEISKDDIHVWKMN